MKPEICFSDMTGTWYVVTKRSKDGKAALIKYPVTDQMKFILERADSYLEKMKRFP